jgi:hypothetical protein
MIRYPLFIGVVTGVLTASPGRAGDGRAVAPVVQSAANRHLGGFVRPDVGFGFLNASGTQSGGFRFEARGAAATFGVAAGGAIAEDHVLAFHFWGTIAANANMSFAFGTSGVLVDNSTFRWIGFGPEYTAYWQGNSYFSISPLLTRATWSTIGATGTTNWDFGLRGALGKEWWVSDHWGLGIAGQVSLAMNRLAGPNASTWSGFGPTIAFSATYN